MEPSGHEKAYLTPFHSALGQPVYLNGLYTGSEFPANDNNIEDGIAHIRYYAGKSMHDLKTENRHTPPGKRFSARQEV